MTPAGASRIPACVIEALDASDMSFDVVTESGGQFVEVIGNTSAGGEMIHVFDFRFGRDVASVRDWGDEALELLECFDAFDVTIANSGLPGAPEGEDLYEDVKGYKDGVLRPLAEALAACGDCVDELEPSGTMKGGD